MALHIVALLSCKNVFQNQSKPCFVVPIISVVCKSFVNTSREKINTEKAMYVYVEISLITKIRNIIGNIYDS